MRLPLTLIRLLPVMLIFLHSCSPPERPVTKEEAALLARRIEAAAVSRNDLVIDNLIDDQSFAKRVAVEAGKPLDKDLIRGAIEGIHSAHIGQQLMQTLGKSGTYLLIKQYEKDNRQHLLFRAYANGAINYIDYELVKQGEQVKVVDSYIYLTGENLSKSLSDALLGVQENMPDMSEKDIQKLQSFKTIKTLLAQGETQKAADIFEKLPDDIKRQKLFELIHIQIAKQMGDSVYSQALEGYRALYPNDPNMHLMMIEAYSIQKNFPKAMESVNKLDSIVGKDPFLDFYRGVLYLRMRDAGGEVAGRPLVSPGQVKRIL